MSWKLRLIESPYSYVPYGELKEGKTEEDIPVVGDCWFAPELLVSEKRIPWMQLASSYDRWRGKRLPLVVCLPGRYNFAVDGMAWSNGGAYGNGWTVEGEPPLITVSPSINIGGLYHGWIKDGVITDDCEGRQFTPDGSKLVR